MLDPGWIALIGITVVGAGLKFISTKRKPKRRTPIITDVVLPQPGYLRYEDRWGDDGYVEMIHATRDQERNVLGRVLTLCQCSEHNEPPPIISRRHEPPRGPAAVQRPSDASNITPLMVYDTNMSQKVSATMWDRADKPGKYSFERLVAAGASVVTAPNGSRQVNLNGSVFFFGPAKKETVPRSKVVGDYTFPTPPDVPEHAHFSIREDMSSYGTNYPRGVYSWIDSETGKEMHYKVIGLRKDMFKEAILYSEAQLKMISRLP